MLFNSNSRADRRRGKRQLLNTSVRIFIESTRVDALGLNLSYEGMCLFTLANLLVGSHIQIEFAAPPSSEPVRVTGVVRYRALYLYGVEFVADEGRSGFRAASENIGPEPSASSEVGD